MATMALGNANPEYGKDLGISILKVQVIKVFQYSRYKY